MAPTPVAATESRGRTSAAGRDPSRVVPPGGRAPRCACTRWWCRCSRKLPTTSNCLRSRSSRSGSTTTSAARDGDAGDGGAVEAGRGDFVFQCGGVAERGDGSAVAGSG
jgi:hypothetical protein